MSNPTEETQGEDNGKKRVKADWNDKTLEIVIKLFVNETLAGNRPNGHFNKTGWKNIISKFALETKKNYDYKQFKNKWDALKKDWQLWTNLVGRETGLGWDPVKQTIDASDEWWDKKLKENPEASKFRTKGLKFVEQLEILFKDVAATGEGAWAPSSGFVPNEVCYVPSRERLVDLDQDENFIDDQPFNEGIENINNDIGTSNPILGASTQEKGKKRKKNDETRTGAAVRLSKQLDRICDAVESRASRRRDEHGCSISEVMEMLRNMTEIERGSELFMLATKLFLKKENREMFVALKDSDLQIEWLKQMQ